MNQAAGAAGEKQFTAYRQQGNHQRAADHLRDIPLPEAVDQKTSQPAQTGIGRDHRRGDKLNQRRAHTGEDQRRRQGDPHLPQALSGGHAQRDGRIAQRAIGVINPHPGVSEDGRDRERNKRRQHRDIVKAKNDDA